MELNHHTTQYIHHPVLFQAVFESWKEFTATDASSFMALPLTGFFILGEHLKLAFKMGSVYWEKNFDITSIISVGFSIGIRWPAPATS
jgi:hypothetical protein